MYFVYIVKFSSLTGLIKRRDEKGEEGRNVSKILYR